jgi:hypothetical protein
MKTGDAIHSVAQPIAQSIDYLFGTGLQNCGGCKTMRANLNAGMNLADAIYDRFWPQQKEKDENAIHSDEKYSG